MKPSLLGTAFQRTDFLRLALLLASAACSRAMTSPDTSRVVGSYILTHVDGASFPLPKTEHDQSVPCLGTVSDGELSLVAGERSPQLYSVSVYSSSVCNPDDAPSQATSVVNDAGSWSTSGADVRFISSPYISKGTYTGTIQSVGETPVVAISFGGHTYTFRQVDPHRELESYLRVSVIDQQGSGVAGALVVLHSPNGQVARVFSGTAGPSFTQASQPGSEVINVAPPAGYALSPGQANPVRVTVAAGQTTPVTIMLKKLNP